MAEVLSTAECLRGAGIFIERDGISLANALRLSTPGRLRPALERLRAISVFEFQSTLPPGSILLAVGIDEVQAAVRERMTGTNQHHEEMVIWSQGSSEIAVRVPCIIRATGGYLTAHILVSTVETGSVECRLVFFLGRVDVGAGKTASVTHTADIPQAIMDAWGDTLRTVVWEGLLDIIEGAVIAASQAAGGIPLRLLGYIGGEDRVIIAVGV